MPQGKGPPCPRCGLHGRHATAADCAAAVRRRALRVRKLGGALAGRPALYCPACHVDLRAHATYQFTPYGIARELRCRGCGRHYQSTEYLTPASMEKGADVTLTPAPQGDRIRSRRYDRADDPDKSRPHRKPDG